MRQETTNPDANPLIAIVDKIRPILRPFLDQHGDETLGEHLFHQTDFLVNGQETRLQQPKTLRSYLLTRNRRQFRPFQPKKLTSGKFYIFKAILNQQDLISLSINWRAQCFTDGSVPNSNNRKPKLVKSWSDSFSCSRN